MNKDMNIKTLTAIAIALVTLVTTSCSTGPSFNDRVEAIVKPYRFNVVAWEMKALFQSDGGEISAAAELPEDNAAWVVEHFTQMNLINALKSEIGSKRDSADKEAELERLENEHAGHEVGVQRIMEAQIREALGAEGIYHPWFQYVKVRVSLPSPYFKLEHPPYIMIISPRGRIETTKTILLNKDISLQDMAKIESEVDRLGVSALVEGLGGLGSTYPALVASNASLDFTIDTAVHEWVHQYLFFTPLGFRYALDRIGVSRNADIAAINETVANMVGKEISRAILGKHYPGYQGNTAPRVKPRFDFAGEMRDIRKTVDRYLAQGEIERAEEFMEEKRQYLATQGYYIRKLNQAYFAFHGGYADVPAFASPIGDELKRLRSQKVSVREFLDTVAGMTSRQDLRLAAGEVPD